jgi:tetratricopeptide (TPR) repeat protein
MDRGFEATDSGTTWLDAGDVQGLQVGSNNVQFNRFGHTPPVVRSSYLEQVRRIAPSALIGRAAELAELAAFCSDDAGHAYGWWRAPAWAGKSALLSWFVLHPPPGIKVVSFFITARHHRQNDRKAFVDNVLEQLAELLKYRGLPPGLTDSTHEAHLIGMLSAAAAACRQSGERLVLVVDGLDEDRGVTVMPDSYSIAGILPRQPPSQLKIVVSSRSDPPLPQDVPEDHPLRGSCRTWDLQQSAHADIVRADAERDLKRMVTTGGVERDILGFVAAAGSGLSIRDLTELINEDEWLVTDHLSSFTGRTFRRVDATYALAHEEMQPTAARLLGTRLRDYQQRLHEWAEHYHQLSWPAGTPDYLLRGYFRTTHRDLARMVRYATDADRHDRMLDHTGGDTVALEETLQAQEALLAVAEADLPAMCRLALHRGDLEERNAKLPLGLPRLWAAVGNIDRAEALIHSVPEDGNRRAVALILLAPEVAAAGHHVRAERLVAMIPSRLYVSADEPGKAICAVVRKIAEGGDYDRAINLARTPEQAFWRSRAHSEVAIAAAIRGEDHAEALAEQVPTPYWRAQTFAVLAKMAARAGNAGLADRLASRAETEADNMPERNDRPFALAFLAHEAKESGDGERAQRLATLAADEASALEDQLNRIDTLTRIVPRLAEILDQSSLAELALLAEMTLNAARGDNQITLERQIRLIGATAAAWHTAGDRERAVAVTDAVAVPSNRDSALLDLVSVAAAAGDLKHAHALLRSFSDSSGKDSALGRIVNTLTGPNAEEHIAELVDAIQDRERYASALTDWGYRLAKRGDLQAATQLAERAEAVVRSAGDPARRVALLVALLSVLVEADDTERARAAADRALAAYQAVPERWRSDFKLAAFVRASARAGAHHTAASAAQLIRDSDARAKAQIDLALSIAQEGKRDVAVDLLNAAEKAAMSVPDVRHRLETIRKAIATLWMIGEGEIADALAGRTFDHNGLDEPTEPAEPLRFPTLRVIGKEPSSLLAKERDQALARAVTQLAADGLFPRAETLTSLIIDQLAQAQARTKVVLAMAKAGHHERARALALSEEQSHRRDSCLRELADTLTDLGAIDQAEEIARSIKDNFQRVEALITLARKVEPVRARSLLAIPLQHGRLPDIMDLVAAACPEAINIIADHLLNAGMRN